jgi:hypothetical protein
MPGNNIDNMDITQEFSRSMSQLGYQLSYANVNVIPFKDTAGVYDFISSFELATAGLNDDQKVPLLAKGFPCGRYRPWFENNLQPLIDKKRSWAEAKARLIERFAEPKDKDQHFKRLKKLEFNPEGGMNLSEFIDEVTHAYKKAIGARMINGQEDDTLLIQHIKASLPSSVIAALSFYSDYRNAKTLDELCRAVREYDSLRGSTSDRPKSDKKEAADFVAMFKQYISAMEAKQEASVNAIVSAIKEDRQYRSNSRDRNYRSQSPVRDNYRDQPMQNNRNIYPPRGLSGGDKSPTFAHRFTNYRSPHGSPKFQRSDNVRHQVSNEDFKRQAFNTEAYYKRFGIPGSPCDVCGDMHHTRHCPATLN